MHIRATGEGLMHTQAEFLIENQIYLNMKVCAECSCATLWFYWIYFSIAEATLRGKLH